MALWIIYSLASALVQGIKDVLVKKVFKKNDVSPTQVIFEEYLLLLLLVLIVFFPKVDILSYKSLWYLYLLKAATLSTATFTYFQLLKKYEISSIAPLMNLSPMFLLILSTIFLGEIISLIQFLGIVLIIISTYVLEVSFHHSKKKDPHKHYFDFIKKLDHKIFLSVFLMLVVISFTAIADKKILNQVDVYTNMFFTSLLIFTTLLIYYLKTSNLKNTFNKVITQPNTLVISIFAIASTFLILLAIGLPTAMVSLVIPIKRTSTLFSSILGGILFHENHLMRKVIATIGMLFGILLIAY